MLSIYVFCQIANSMSVEFTTPTVCCEACTEKKPVLHHISSCTRQESAMYVLKDIFTYGSAYPQGKKYAHVAHKLITAEAHVIHVYLLNT